jgi:hypothetical protein
MSDGYKKHLAPHRDGHLKESCYLLSFLLVLRVYLDNLPISSGAITELEADPIPRI